MELNIQQDGHQMVELVVFETITCFSCKVVFAITREHRARLLKSHDDFYCPNGHRQAYIKSATDKAKEALQIELDRTKQRLESNYEYNSQLSGQVWELKQEIKELRKKECPHCTKRYINLDLHIKKHHAGI